MKRLALPFLILFLTVFSVPAQGLESVRIGVIDFQKALDQCEAGKDAKLELEKLFKDKEKILIEQRNEIKHLRETLEKQSTMLSPDVLKEKKRELAFKSREFKRKYNDFVEEMKLREKDLRNPILRELERIVKNIGKKGGYTLIVHKDKSVIIYSPEAIDITDELIRRYNAYYRKTKR
ncbi:MAG: OmpH family outer membrane protein [Deltaproteobacteria bacterium]|nr:OmpH family outer membrane protein [Deltaproteobacteria bacterium]MBW2305874.1 OmpH family outer membrane protein [Deltaproteobacteria bacterium]